MSKYDIEKDIADAFKQLRSELKTHLNNLTDISGKRKFLETHVPKEVIYKINLLFDTLLNGLMANATTQLEAAEADTEVQNKFYEADFRKQLQSWVEGASNNFRLSPEVVVFSFDPRLKNGLIAGSTSLLIGAGISTLILNTVKATTAISATKTTVAKTAATAATTVFTPTIITVGLITIVVSALAFKFSYQQASSKASNQIKNDIEIYLTTSEAQAKDWLYSIEAVFEDYTKEFFYQNNVKIS